MAIECLMDCSCDYKALIQSIKKYKQIFETLTIENNDSKIFLASMEELIMHKVIGLDFLNHSYAIFYCLYEEDIVDEDEILEWYQNGDDEYRIIDQNEAQLIRDKTKPFINSFED